MANASEEFAAAAFDVASRFAENADMFSDTMESLSCGEADALVKMIRLAGFPGEAALLLECHAEGDDEGDAHYREES